MESECGLTRTGHRGCRKYTIWMWDKKKVLKAAKVQLVRYTMWDPNICLQEAVFFPSSLSQGQGTLVGFHGGSTTEWVWLHCTNLRAF